MVAPSRFFEEIVDFLTSTPSPAQVLAFKPSAALQNRAEELLQKSKDGSLTETEQKDLEYFLVIEHLMRMAKIRANQRILNS
ncbi:MAG: hypothetical protein IT259_18075 [Saprospiraceae bacterium]|mgnify:CR=1 FL=1|nr:hypothetical protein [Saprospiraceae bacterium]